MRGRYKTLGFAQTHKGLLEEKQRFATGSCNATAPLDCKNFPIRGIGVAILIVQILFGVLFGFEFVPHAGGERSSRMKDAPHGINQIPHARVETVRPCR